MIDVDDLKAKVNIVDIIEEVVPLKKSGKDYFGCCPFHGEKTPSFSVSERDQFFHCFGCGTNGSVIDFVMEYKGVEFLEACKYLGADIYERETMRGEVIKKRPMYARMPFDDSLSDQEISEFLSKCDQLTHGEETIFTYGCDQVLILTDINSKPVNLALWDGIKHRYYNKHFVYAACAIFGELSGEVVMCEEWGMSNTLHRISGKNTICFFEPLNLFYIWQELKRRNCEIKVICKSDEAKFHADNFGLIGE